MISTIVLFDDQRRDDLLPLTFTRPVAEVRLGILTISQKWSMLTGAAVYYLTQDYLQAKYPNAPMGNPVLLINGGVCPDMELIEKVNSLRLNEAIVKDDTVIAAMLNSTADTLPAIGLYEKTIEYKGDILEVKYPWDIFRYNGEALVRDYTLITRGRKSQPISTTNTVLNPENVFIEEGARVECAILNAETGPIYIGKDAEVMEGSMVRGPFALCKHSTLKMGAKIYGPTTVGPHCKVGGEVNNSVFFAFSNKAHDGFIGNSVIGEWCNLGADTNNSNLKNNYASVKLWSYREKGFVDTGLQFCGLIMGDHSKCGINTMFNTGTVVGVSANIFGEGFPRNFIPCFSWGGAAGFTTYQPEKAFETARIMMSRRELPFTDIDKDILLKVFELTQLYRMY
ncbi:MAG TPA: glucose-1-phosphate thymidylyltransferase [Bacteroidales bacterium]|nr:glucose-1-phosphate thymidylyltransferase [Bacteroidales bacterium]